MGSINLDDVESMEVSTSKDWLDIGGTIQACSTRASMTKDKPTEQDQEADTQPVISNLPQLKDCEFDHNYILHHLEQLEIDPTLW